MALPNHFYVYVLFRPWDGSPFYIGKGSGKRWLRHKHRSRHIANIIRKAADRGMDIPAIKIRENLTEIEAFTIEHAFIKAIGRKPNGPLVNLTDGGEGASGAVRSAITRAKMSIIMKGNRNPLGCKRSPETLEKLSMIQSNRSPTTIAKMRDANMGKILSDEHRRKLSSAKKGKSLSAIHRTNIGRSHLGKTRKNTSKMSAAQVGNKKWLGRSHSIATRELLSRIASEREATKKADRLHRLPLDQSGLHQKIAEELLPLPQLELPLQR